MYIFKLYVYTYTIDIMNTQCNKYDYMYQFLFFFIYEEMIYIHINRCFQLYMYFLYKKRNNLCWGEPLNFHFLIYCSHQALRIFLIKVGSGRHTQGYRKIAYITSQIPYPRFPLCRDIENVLDLNQQLECTNPTHLANIRLEIHHCMLFLTY